MKVRRGYFTPGREHSLLTLAGRLRRQSHLRVISTFGISQGVILVTSLARIPLIVSAIGSKGYGVALAVTSLQAWMFLVLISITDLTGLRYLTTSDEGMLLVWFNCSTMRLEQGNWPLRLCYSVCF